MYRPSPVYYFKGKSGCAEACDIRRCAYKHYKSNKSIPT